MLRPRQAATLHYEADTLRAVLDRQAGHDPDGAAELAEVMAISEEIVSAGGFATDLDGRLPTDWTEAQNFAAKLRLRALRQPPTIPAPPVGSYEVYFSATGQADDYERWERLSFVPNRGMFIQLGNGFWEIHMVHWVQDDEAASLSGGWFECHVKSPNCESAEHMTINGWQVAGAT